MTTEKNPNWQLQNLHITRTFFGPDSGTYKANISFVDKENNSFSFQVRPEATQKLLDLIKQEVIASATTLGENLAKSLTIELPQTINKIKGHGE